MKRVLFVTMHRPKRSPGQRFRFEQYIPYLEQNGYVCDMSYIVSEADDRIIYAPGHYAEKLLIFAKSVVTRLRDVLAVAALRNHLHLSRSSDDQHGRDRDPTGRERRKDGVRLR